MNAVQGEQEHLAFTSPQTVDEFDVGVVHAATLVN